jgi:hypothetical protein
MSIGPGRPGEIEPPGHPFFGSAKEMKTHFVLPSLTCKARQFVSLPKSPASSTGRCNTGLKFTRRGFKAQGLSGALI